MNLVVLVDNTPNPDKPTLEIEHGLCFYIEIEQTKLLLDVGASDKFLRNATKLGIDIEEIDYLILSHAHNDHTGGLSYFLERNTKAQIFLSSEISNVGYYSTRRGLKRNISVDYNLIEKNKNRFIQVTENIYLSPSITIIGRIPVTHELPKANKTLLAGDVLDNFNHEIALLLKSNSKALLLSSCTHLGLLNTLEACKGITISHFIGGLHLINSDSTNSFETDKEISFIGKTIASRYPNLKIYTGHCTGTNAQQILSTILSDNICAFYTGFTLTI